MITLESYNKQCKDTTGGIKEFYIAAYEKWQRSKVSVLNMNLISMPQSNFYKFQCDGSYSQDGANENGNVFFNQSLDIKLPKAYNSFNVLNFTKQYYRIIAKTNNNHFLIFGMFNGLEGSIKNSSGNNKTEFNGFDVSFSGKEKDTSYLIPSEIITSEESGITIIDTSLFNYDINLDF